MYGCTYIRMSVGLVIHLHTVINHRITESSIKLINGKKTGVIVAFHIVMVHLYRKNYTECAMACPPTCKTPRPFPCTSQCVPGCQCPAGTVLDEENNKCVEHFPTPLCERGKYSALNKHKNMLRQIG